MVASLPTPQLLKQWQKEEEDILKGIALEIIDSGAGLVCLLQEQNNVYFNLLLGRLLPQEPYTSISYIGLTCEALWQCNLLRKMTYYQFVIQQALSLSTIYFTLTPLVCSSYLSCVQDSNMYKILVQ